MPDEIILRQRHLEPPVRLSNRLPLAGKLMIVAQHDGVTHERIGNVERLEKKGDRVVCVGEAHDCSIDLASVTSVVLDRGAADPGPNRTGHFSTRLPARSILRRNG